MTDGRSRLFFVDALRKAMKQDHNNRGGDRFSERGTEVQIEKDYPELGTYLLLTTTKRYVAHLSKNPGSKREVSEKKLRILLCWLFVNNKGLDWTITKGVIASFEEGKYKPLLKEILQKT